MPNTKEVHQVVVKICEDQHITRDVTAQSAEFGQLVSQ